MDFDGSMWVGNRHNVLVGTTELGHVVKIGSGLGFQWIDRNGNGLIDTSTGLAFSFRRFRRCVRLLYLNLLLATADRPGRAASAEKHDG